MKITWKKRTENTLIERVLVTTKIGIVDFEYSMSGGNLMWYVNGRLLNLYSMSLAQAKRLVRSKSDALLKAKNIKEVTLIMNGPKRSDSHET